MDNKWAKWELNFFLSQVLDLKKKAKTAAKKLRAGITTLPTFPEIKGFPTLPTLPSVSLPKQPVRSLARQIKVIILLYIDLKLQIGTSGLHEKTHFSSEVVTLVKP